MLKSEELTPYWEETIEGETIEVVKEAVEKEKEKTTEETKEDEI